MDTLTKEHKLGTILKATSVPVSKPLADPSALIAHEVAYCMGQLRNPHAVSALVKTLKNENIHPMVRHEAAEALGAIGGDTAYEVLQQYKDHHVREIKDTCAIAISLLDWKKQNADKKDANADHPIYHSVDPAPPAEPKTVAELKTQLLDHNLSLFERYKAMFALRNDSSKEAIEVQVLSQS